MSYRTAIFIASVGLGLSGCTLAEFTSINRTFSIAEEESKLIDVKQRSILVAADRYDPNNNFKIVCAEPSPDALTIFAAGLSGQAQNAAGVGAALAGSVAESGGSIGLRTQSIQLLRDSFYRLCESYLSGAISKEEYVILQRRYQQNMIALLAIEQLTGAVRAPTIVLTSNASADAGVNLANLVRNLDNAQKKKKDLEEEQKKIVDPKGTGANANTVIQGKIDVEQAKIDQLQKQIEDATGPTATASGFGQLESGVDVARATYAASLEHVANAVQNISLAIIQSDYAGQLCFSHYKTRLAGVDRSTDFATKLRDLGSTLIDDDTLPKIESLEHYCANVFALHIWQQKEKTRRSNRISKAFYACVTGKTESGQDTNNDFCNSKGFIESVKELIPDNQNNGDIKPQGEPLSSSR